MMATRRSFAGFFNRSCVWAAMYCTETTPNRPPLGWGRNVYWRFRSLSTPSAMAVVIHRNRFCLSTFSASGTAWALEYTPARMSTFSTLSSRSASLIATSAFDWLSPSTWTILYLPRTPPRSLIRSIIILAPRQQLSEPAAENGPEWSKRTPILMVGACASTRGASAATAASAAISTSAGTMRVHFIGTSSSQAGKVGCSVSRAPGKDEPLAALTAPRRPQRRLRALEAERRREAAAQLGARDGEGRPRGDRAQRKEAGQQPPTRPDDAGHRPDVLVAAGGVDGAEARVFPHAVEGVGGLNPQREDVALLEGDAHAVPAGEDPGGRNGGRREVVAHHVVAAGGQEARIVTAPAAQHGDAPARRRRPLDEIDERRRRCPQLPAVATGGVEPVPEIRCAHTGHANPWKSAMARSAPAASNSRAVWAVVRPTTRMPALRAACTPTTASSNTRQPFGGHPRPAAARRNTSGFGLPQRTSSAVTITSKCSRTPISLRSA